MRHLFQSNRGYEQPNAQRKEQEGKLREIEKSKERLRETFPKGADLQGVADASQRSQAEEDEVRRELAAAEAKARTQPR